MRVNSKVTPPMALANKHKGTVKEKSSEVADSMKKGAVAVAENVQGRIAPKTVKREGYLTKQGRLQLNTYFIPYIFLLIIY